MHSLRPERALTDILPYLKQDGFSSRKKMVRKSNQRTELTKDLNEA